jgi:hypothetical protein
MSLRMRERQNGLNKFIGSIVFCIHKIPLFLRDSVTIYEFPFPHAKARVLFCSFCGPAEALPFYKTRSSLPLPEQD